MVSAARSQTPRLVSVSRQSALVWVGGSAVAVFLGAGWACRVWTETETEIATTTATTECEALVVVAEDQASSGLRVRVLTDTEESTWSMIQRALRIIRRLFKLAVVFSPVVALYPLHWILSRTRKALSNKNENENDETTDAHHLSLHYMEDSSSGSLSTEWYYRLCLYCVEWSGAACIKTMQWAGSRPDLFGNEFCAVFSRLQDSTRPHSWKHTRKAMADAYGEDWEDKLELGEILGSGCIAQVYKGAIRARDDDAGGNGNGNGNDNGNGNGNDNGNGNRNHNQNQNQTERPVAVKVMHPRVEDDIDADLDILRLAVYTLETIGFGPIRNLRWLNLPGFIDEMATMLKIQLDLRQEGEHLVKFNENFANNPSVVFPELVEGYAPTKRVLCETFCEGVPIMEFVRNHKGDSELLRNLCIEAIKAICQMIFLDNFTHGDLHPGNVLITKDYKFVLLDVGITTVHSDADHRLVSDVLAAFVRKDGRKAGRYMIDNSNARLEAVGDRAIDEEQFIDKIELLTIAASGKNYFMEKLGTYITYICNSAATHHVMLNQAFISSALAVKVQEGIGLALDPSVQICKVAIPIILEGERKHGRVQERARQLVGIDRLVDWWNSVTTPA